MNAPATRIQLFAVLSLCALMLIGALIYVAVENLGERAQAPAIGGHGIETSWPSAMGDNRVWSLTPGGHDYRPWLEAHVEVVKTAESLMPVKEK